MKKHEYENIIFGWHPQLFDALPGQIDAAAQPCNNKYRHDISTISRRCLVIVFGAMEGRPKKVLLNDGNVVLRKTHLWYTEKSNITAVNAILFVSRFKL